MAAGIRKRRSALTLYDASIMQHLAFITKIWPRVTLTENVLRESEVTHHVAYQEALVISLYQPLELGCHALLQLVLNHIALDHLNRPSGVTGATSRNENH